MSDITFWYDVETLKSITHLKPRARDAKAKHIFRTYRLTGTYGPDMDPAKEADTSDVAFRPSSATITKLQV